MNDDLSRISRRQLLRSAAGAATAMAILPRDSVAAVVLDGAVELS